MRPICHHLTVPHGSCHSSYWGDLAFELEASFTRALGMGEANVLFFDEKEKKFSRIPFESGWQPGPIFLLA